MGKHRAGGDGHRGRPCAYPSSLGLVGPVVARRAPARISSGGDKFEDGAARHFLV
jgi:hypothetical protein